MLVLLTETNSMQKFSLLQQRFAIFLYLYNHIIIFWLKVWFFSQEFPKGF